MALKPISVVPLLSLLLTVGCTGPAVHQERHFDSPAPPAEAPRLAVPDLTNHAEHPAAGAIMAALLETELRGRGEVEVVVDPDSADAVVRGVVTEFGYQHGLHEEPVVGMTATLRRTCDQRSVWAASHASVGEGYFFRESVAQVAQRLARRLVDDLAEDFPAGRLTCEGATPEPVAEVERRTLDIRFGYRSATIRPEDRPELEALARQLREDPAMRMRIEGHTDAEGPAEYNRDLSRQRAESVRDYLVETAGIASRRVEMVGYGEARPVASNESEAGRARNRRIEAVILLPDGGARRITGERIPAPGADEADAATVGETSEGGP